MALNFVQGVECSDIQFWREGKLVGSQVAESLSMRAGSGGGNSPQQGYSAASCLPSGKTAAWARQEARLRRGAGPRRRPELPQRLERRHGDADGQV